MKRCTGMLLVSLFALQGCPAGRTDTRASISGRVVLATLAGASDYSRVRIELGRGEGGVTPEADGTFELGDIEADTYNVQVTYIGGLSATATGSAYRPWSSRVVARAGAAVSLGEIRPQLAQGAIAGTVRAPANERAEGSDVALQEVDELGQPVGPAMTVKTGAGGAYVFPTVPVGHYKIIVTPQPGQAFAAAAPSQGCAAAATVEVGDQQVSVAEYQLVTTRVALDPGANELVARNVDTWFVRGDVTSVTVNAAAGFAADGRAWTGTGAAPAYSSFLAGGYPVNVAVDGTAEFHLQLRDPCGYESDVYTLTLIKDTTPPAAGTVLFAGGLPRVSSQVIPVLIAGTEAATMAFYETPATQPCPVRACTDSGYAPFTSSTVFALSTGLGNKRVCWRFCDQSGNGSTTGQGDVELTTYLPRPRPVLTALRCTFSDGRVTEPCTSYPVDNPPTQLSVVGSGMAFDTAVALDALLLDCTSPDDTARACSVSGNCDGLCTVATLPSVLTTQSGTHTVRLVTPDPVEGGVGASAEVLPLTVLAPTPELLSLTVRGVTQELSTLGQPIEDSVQVSGCGRRIMSNAAFFLDAVLATSQAVTDGGSAECPQRFDVTLSTRGLMPRSDVDYEFRVENPAPGGGTDALPFGVTPEVFACSLPELDVCSVDLRPTRAVHGEANAASVEFSKAGPFEDGWVVVGGNAAVLFNDAAGNVVGGAPARGPASLVPVPPMTSVHHVTLVDTMGIHPRMAVRRGQHHAPIPVIPPISAGPQVLKMGNGQAVNAVVDFNGDGRMDLVGVGGNGPLPDVAVSFSLAGPATFGPWVPTLPVTYLEANPVPTAGDVTGDGWQDEFHMLAYATGPVSASALPPPEALELVAIIQPGAPGAEVSPGVPSIELEAPRYVPLFTMADVCNADPDPPACGIAAFSEQTRLWLDAVDMDLDSQLDFIAVLGAHVVVALRDLDGAVRELKTARIPDAERALGYVFGDVNGDGWRDLVATYSDTANEDGFTVLLLGEAGGGLGVPTIIHPQSNEAAPLLLDTDWDGRLDVILSGTSTHELCVLHNTGASFTPSCQALVDEGGSTMRPEPVGVWDMFSVGRSGVTRGPDGIPDVLIFEKTYNDGVNNDPAVLGMAGNLDGTLVMPPAAIRVVVSGLDTPRLLDDVLDGTPEIVGEYNSSQFGVASVAALQLASPTTLTTSEQSRGGSRARVRFTTVEDVVLVTIVEAGNDLRLAAVRPGTPPFLSSFGLAIVGDRPQAPAVADLNGDGLDDALLWVSDTQMAAVFQSGAGIAFTSARKQVLNVPADAFNDVTVTVANVNGGGPDIVAFRTDDGGVGVNKLRIRSVLNTGGAVPSVFNPTPVLTEFLPTAFFPGSTEVSAERITAGDINGDGYDDIVADVDSFNTSDRALVAFMSTGTGAFVLETALPPLTRHLDSLLLVDLDDDGLKDLLLAGKEDGPPRIRVHRQLAAGLFDPQYVEFNPYDVDYLRDPNGNASSLQVLDVNGDGLTDMAFAFERSAGVFLRVKPGLAVDSFAPAMTFPFPMYQSALVYADMNRDGVQDAVIPRVANTQVEIRYLPPAVRLRGVLSARTPLDIAAGANATVVLAGSPLVIERLAVAVNVVATAPVGSGIGLELEAPDGQRASLACALAGPPSDQWNIHIADPGCVDLSGFLTAQVGTSAHPWRLHVSNGESTPITVTRADLFIQGRHGNP